MADGSRNQDFADLSDIESQLAAMNSSIPAKYNGGHGTFTTGNVMTKYEFKLNGTVVSTFDFTYDGDGNQTDFVIS